ncbi:MAG: TlpA family protein disulfide reductase [Betaproteobacteria bacterium]|nr:TlpA family protein disulfide reductase [Betaproteobacteria bacterium]
MAVAVLAVATGIYVNLSPPVLPAAVAPTAPTPLVDQRFLATPFVDLSGKTRTMEEWKGRVVLVNFWATWCAPCREEMPALQQTQAEFAHRGFEVVGIALDNAEATGRFVAEFKIGYPILIGYMGMIDLMRQLGNKSGALPYSVVLDRQGEVAKSHLGLLTLQKMRDLVEPVLSR